MQVDQTTTLKYVADLGTAFTVSSAKLKSIVAPDSSSKIDIIANISPGGSANPQTITALFTPTMAGQYTAKWEITTGTSAVITSPLILWVVWTNIYDRIRSLLGDSIILDDEIDGEYEDFLTQLYAFAPSLPKFYLLNTVINFYNLPYSIGLEQGLAKIIAGLLRPYVGGKRPTGEVSLFKKGTTTLQYGVGSYAKSLITLEEQWIIQGWDILAANIPEIFSVLSEQHPNDMIMSRGEIYVPSNDWE